MTITPSLLRTRFALPSTLVSLSLPAEVVQQLQSIVGKSVSVLPVASVESAADALLRRTDACLVIPVPGDAAETRWSGVARLLAAFPRVPTIAIFVHGTSTYRGTLRLGGVGITELVEAGPRIVSDSLLTALTRCHADGVASRLWEEAAIDVPEHMRLLLRTALRLAHRPVSVVGLADVLGMHERSLRKYCEQWNLSSPQWIIGWARLLVAAHYLDEPARSLPSVAELLEYASTSALRNQLRRYAGVSPSALRASGTLRGISAALKTAVRDAPQHIPPERAWPPLHLVANGGR